MAVNDDLLDLVIKRAVMLERYKNGTVRDLTRLLNRVTFPEIETKLTKNLNNIKSRGYNVTQSKKLQGTINQATAKFNRDLETYAANLEKELEEFAKREAKWFAEAINEASPVRISIRQPSPSMLAQVLKRPMDGLDYKVRWQQVARGFERSVRQSLTLGIAEGESVPQMAARVRNSAMGLSQRGSEALVRTAVTHTSAQTRAITAQENEEFLEGEQWVSTLDSRTTLICMSLDGKVFPVGEGKRPPAHVNCRSTMVPVLKSWQDLGFKAQDLPKETRESMNGRVAGDLTYPQWLKKQPAAFQDKVLGKERAKLWRDGKVKFDRFVNDKLEVVALDEL